jgi:hypothetical protein
MLCCVHYCSKRYNHECAGTLQRIWSPAYNKTACSLVVALHAPLYCFVVESARVFLCSNLRFRLQNCVLLQIDHSLFMLFPSLSRIPEQFGFFSPYGQSWGYMQRKHFTSKSPVSSHSHILHHLLPSHSHMLGQSSFYWVLKEENSNLLIPARKGCSRLL